MRKRVTIEILEEGRDKGKLFQITEMPAAQAESFAARTFLALAKSGIEIPEEIARAGLSGLASLGLRAFAGMQWEDLEPLLGEMFKCVSIIRDPKSGLATSLVGTDDIEEWQTRLKLRAEVLKLHVGFLEAAVPSIFNKAS